MKAQVPTQKLALDPARRIVPKPQISTKLLRKKIKPNPRPKTMTKFGFAQSNGKGPVHFKPNELDKLLPRAKQTPRLLPYDSL
jgi:hypothetical protein